MGFSGEVPGHDVLGPTGGAATSESEPSGRRRTIPVLLYHDVGPPSKTPGLRDYIVEPSLFAEHLAALAGEGFSTFRARQVPDLERSPEPEKAVVITFDDGFANLTECAPLLERHGATATIFVPTALIGGRAVWLDALGEGQRQILGWEQLRELHDAGLEIAPHGHSHVPLDVLPRDQILSDLTNGRVVLEDGLGDQVRAVSYPHGQHSHRVRAAARECGYAVAFEVGDDLHVPSPRRRFCVRRILVTPDMGSTELLEVIRQGRTSPALRRIRLELGPILQFANRRRRSLDLARRSRSTRRDR